MSNCFGILYRSHRRTCTGYALLSVRRHVACVSKSRNTPHTTTPPHHTTPTNHHIGLHRSALCALNPHMATPQQLTDQANQIAACVVLNEYNNDPDASAYMDGQNVPVPTEATEQIPLTRCRHQEHSYFLRPCHG